MPRIRSLLCLLVPLASAASHAADPQGTRDEAPTLSRIYAEALTHGQAYDNLRTLVESYPYRLSGSSALTGAVTWAGNTLRLLKVDRVETQPVQVPHWVRGEPESAFIAAQGARPAEPLSCLALGGSSATPPGGLTAPVVEVHSLAELNHLGAGAVKGRIVFFNRPMDPTVIAPGAAYAGAVDQRSRGPLAAARLGAVAALVRSMTHAHDDVPHTGVTTFGTGQAGIPAVALSTLAADHLDAALAADPKTEVTVNVHSSWLPDAPSANVIGEIRGSEDPGQVILVGGHLDSWDVAPGAHDDGAGVVQSIEVLRIFKALGLRPRHTVRCVLFVNEENGGRGAAAYAAAAKASSEHHILAIETDNGGFGPTGFRLGNTHKDAAERAARWKPLFEPYGLYSITEGSGGADVMPLAVLGVTVGELTPNSQRYFDIHHTRRDSIDQVNPRELELGAAALASLAWLVDQEGL